MGGLGSQYFFIFFTGLVLILLNGLIIYYLTKIKNKFPTNTGFYTLIYTTAILVLQFIVIPWCIYAQYEKGFSQTGMFGILGLLAAPFSKNGFVVIWSGISSTLFFVTIYTIFASLVSIQNRPIRSPRLVVFVNAVTLITLIISVLSYGMSLTESWFSGVLLMALIVYLSFPFYAIKFAFLSYLSLPLIGIGLYFLVRSLNAAANASKKTQQNITYVTTVHISILLLVIYQALWTVYNLALNTYWPLNLY